MGAAAMIPMAMELYGRNKATGERCLKLLCGSIANADAVTRELYSKMYRSSYSPAEGWDTTQRGVELKEGSKARGRENTLSCFSFPSEP